MSTTLQLFHKYHLSTFDGHFNSFPPPGQNGRHFADDFFRCIFVNEKKKLIQISLKVVPKGPTDNKSALVWIMAWRQIGDKPLSEPKLTRFIDAYICGTRGRRVNRHRELNAGRGYN